MDPVQEFNEGRGSRLVRSNLVSTTPSVGRSSKDTACVVNRTKETLQLICPIFIMRLSDFISIICLTFEEFL